MEGHVEQSAADNQAPVDYGVQIRFIDNLQDTRKIKKPKKNLGKSGTYGVVVRVQGISGQPFVVLNNSEGALSAPGASGRTDGVKDAVHEGNGDAIPGAHTRRTGARATEFEMPENPYGDAPPSSADSRGASSDEETGARCYAKVCDSGARAQINAGSLRPAGGDGRSSLPRRKPSAHQEEQLRKVHSYGSLLISDDVEFSGEAGPSYQYLPEERAGFRVPSPAVSANGERSVNNLNERSRGSSDHKHPEKPWPNAGYNPTNAMQPVAKASSVTDISLKSGDTIEIDTKPLSSVDSLISKFDGKGGQQRGRTGRHNRISPEERRRSRSLDGRRPQPSGAGLDARREVETNRGYETSGSQKPYRSSDIMDVGKDFQPARVLETKPVAVTKESLSPIHFTSQSYSLDKAYTTGFLNKEQGLLPAFSTSSLPRKWNQNQMEIEPIVEMNHTAAVFAEQNKEPTMGHYGFHPSLVICHRPRFVPAFTYVQFPSSAFILRKGSA
ncbi:cingulin-like [Rhinoraja longicauda]